MMRAPILVRKHPCPANADPSTRSNDARRSGADQHPFRDPAPILVTGRGTEPWISAATQAVTATLHGEPRTAPLHEWMFDPMVVFSRTAPSA